MGDLLSRFQSGVQGSPGVRTGAQRRESAPQYLFFQLGRQGYAIPAEMVGGLMSTRGMLPLKDHPARVRGVLETQGRGIPVLDLRVELGLTAARLTNRSAIIVVDMDKANRLRVGLLVDSVLSIAHVRLVEIGRARPQRAPAEYFLGSLRVSGRAKLLLDLKQMFSAERFRGYESLLY